MSLAVEYIHFPSDSYQKYFDSFVSGFEEINTGHFKTYAQLRFQKEIGVHVPVIFDDKIIVKMFDDYYSKD